MTASTAEGVARRLGVTEAEAEDLLRLRARLAREDGDEGEERRVPNRGGEDDDRSGDDGAR